MIGKKKKIKEPSFDDQKSNTSDDLQSIKEVLENTQSNIKKALALIKEGNVDKEELLASLQQANETSEGLVETSGQQRVIEGVFNGEKFVGSDGQEYNVPPNYASKSKLIEGDILKLTINKNGSFVYKQIGPIDRQQLLATLAKTDSGNDWYAVDDKKQWKLLTAAVTYFQGQAGDEVVILIPKGSKSTWAAVENIIKTSTA